MSIKRKQINFNATAEEHKAVLKIIERFEELVLKPKGIEKDRLDMVMDIIAVHLNHHRLDLDGLLNMNDYDFCHDVLGIQRNVNRETGMLENQFVPRCMNKKTSNIRIEDKHIVVGQGGKISCVINPALAKEKGLDDEQIQALNTSHQIKDFLFGLAKKSSNETEIEMLASLVESLEFLQQKIWGFIPDRNHHRFFDFPGCTCPKIDNEDRLGGGERLYNPECPVHKKELDEQGKP